MAKHGSNREIRHAKVEKPDGSVGNEIVYAEKSEYSDSLSVDDIIALKQHFPEEAARCAKALAERNEIENKNSIIVGQIKKQLAEPVPEYTKSLTLTIYSSIISKYILIFFFIGAFVKAYIDNNENSMLVLSLLAGFYSLPEIVRAITSSFQPKE